MLLANFKGRSFVSRAIRFVTRSDYSHTALLFDDQAAAVAGSMRRRGELDKDLFHYSSGSVIEAWQGGVKNSPSLSTLHAKGTIVDLFSLNLPLSVVEEERLITFAGSSIGEPYSYWNVLFYFVLRWPGKEDGAWFCSELAHASYKNAGRMLFERTEDWRVPPDWIPRTPLVRPVGQFITQ